MVCVRVSWPAWRHPYHTPLLHCAHPRIRAQSTWKRFAWDTFASSDRVNPCQGFNKNNTCIVLDGVGHRGLPRDSVRRYRLLRDSMSRTCSPGVTRRRVTRLYLGRIPPLTAVCVAFRIRYVNNMDMCDYTNNLGMDTIIKVHIILLTYCMLLVVRCIPRTRYIYINTHVYRRLIPRYTIYRGCRYVSPSESIFCHY